MQTIYTITDTTTCPGNNLNLVETTVTGTLEDIWPTIEDWFDLEMVFEEAEDGTEITCGTLLDELRTKLEQGENYHGQAAALGLKVEIHADQETAS